VVGHDDSTPGQVYLYVGDKRRTGNPIERAGLIGGSLYGVRVTNGGATYANGSVTRENNGPISGTFVLENVSDVAVGPGATLQTTSVARHITEFARPEDGAWDTQNPRTFYFVVTVAPLECGEPAEVSRGLRRNLQERDPAVTRRSSGLGHNGASTILQGDSMWRIRSTRLGILIGVTVVTAAVTVMADPSGKSALNTPRLTFVLWGDMPYDAAQAVKLPALIADINGGGVLSSTHVQRRVAAFGLAT
jgi:hypothetical protein